VPAFGLESVGHGGNILYEMLAFGMFFLDGLAAFAKVDKLSFLAEAIQTSQIRYSDDAEPSAVVVHAVGDQPFIWVERSADFADNLYEDFFL
jgi:hypothetical protein